MTTLGSRVIEADHDTDRAILLTPGFSEWTHSLEPLGKDFAATGYDAHLLPPIGQEDREQPFYDISKDADRLNGYVTNMRETYDWVAGMGNSLGAITQGYTEKEHPSTFDALIATTVPPSVETCIPRWGIEALDRLPHSAIRAASDIAHHLLNQTSPRYQRRTGELRALTKQRGEAQFGATRIESSSSLADRLRDTSPTEEFFEGGDAPVLFAYGGNDSLHTGRQGMRHTGDLPEPVTSMLDTVGNKGRSVDAYVLPGADHGFNRATGVDDDFNHDMDYHSIRAVMKNFLAGHGGLP